MTPGPLDHLFVAALVLLVPLAGARELRRIRAGLSAAGRVGSGVRGKSYRRGIALQLVAGAAVLALWAASDRAPESLVTSALLPAGWWTWVAWGVTLLACALLTAQVGAVRRNPESLSSARRQMAAVEDVLPHTPAELKLFLGLSLAAGVCEEIVYRGYLLAYFDSLAGPAAAVLGATLIFGLGHAYQGAAGVMRTGLAGLLLAGAYILSGSLLAAVLLHVVIDVTSGVVAYFALRAMPSSAVRGVAA